MTSLMFNPLRSCETQIENTKGDLLDKPAAETIAEPETDQTKQTLDTVGQHNRRKQHNNQNDL